MINPDLQKILKDLTAKGVTSIAITELANLLDSPLHQTIHQLGGMIHLPQLFQFCMAHTTPPVQGPVGRAPDLYLKQIGVDPASFPSHGIDLTRPITREQARTICSDSKVDALTAYAVAMAWGAQNLKHFKASKDHENILILIGELRSSGRSRSEDFHRAKDLLEGVPGIGISYFTKLLFLCRPKADSYILDQWTAKSLDVLLQDSPVELSTWGGPVTWTTREDYERYCGALEAIAHLLGTDWTGELIETALFDHRGGEWRNHVRACYDGDSCDEGKSPQRKVVPVVGYELSLRLADAILEAHTLGADLGMNLPNGEIPSIHEGHTPRVYCGRQGKAEWYYWVNQGSVRIGLFFPKRYVGDYDAMREKLGIASHDFGNGITGNGGAGGVTRAITATVPRGSDSSSDEYQEIAEEAVERMAALLSTLKI